MTEFDRTGGTYSTRWNALSRFLSENYEFNLRSAFLQRQASGAVALYMITIIITINYVIYNAAFSPPLIRAGQASASANRHHGNSRTLKQEGGFSAYPG